MPARDPNTPPPAAKRPDQPDPAAPPGHGTGGPSAGVARRGGADGERPVSGPARRPDRRAGLSQDQETVLVAIGHAMEDLTGHADALSQWRLAQIEAALAALDRGAHDEALDCVDRATLPADAVPESERRAAEHMEQRLHAEELKSALAARRAGRRSER